MAFSPEEVDPLHTSKWSRVSESGASLQAKGRKSTRTKTVVLAQNSMLQHAS